MRSQYTRKTYLEIAKAIKDTMPSIKQSDYVDYDEYLDAQMQRAYVKIAVHAIAEVFQRDNQKFSSAIFITACGL